MNYHVPPVIENRSASRVVHSNGGATSAAASPPHPASAPDPVEAGGRSRGGVTVGQGLLNGRRLAVRVAPPPMTSVTPAAPIPPHAVASTRPCANEQLAGVDAPPESGMRVCPKPSRSLALDPATLTTEAPHTRVDASSVYGRGIVRISELRRRGVLTVESGLRLATLPGTRSVATGTSNRGIDTAHTEINGDAHYLCRDSVQDGTTVQRSKPQRGSAARRSSASFSSSLGRTRGGRVTASTGDAGQQRGRGSRSNRSRTSAVVNLRADGQLCDHRWFTARGRRCFVYDGRTYTGSSAHRMWEKVKEAARHRDLTHSQPTMATMHGVTMPPSRTRADTGSSYRTAAVPEAERRFHRASVRARTAAQQAFLSRTKEQRSTSASRNPPVEPTAVVAKSLPDEWGRLMKELGVLSDEESDAGVVGSAAQGPGVTTETKSKQSARAVSSHCPPSREVAVSANSINAEGVIEIGDSDSTSEDTGGSDTDASAESSTRTPSRDSIEGHHAGITTDASNPGALPQWPQTSFFSDVSSGWSSTSSFTTSPAHPPASSPVRSPKRKRVKQEDTKAFSDPSSNATPARTRSYHGVKVVEQDGWVYPVDVFESQQQQQQQNTFEVAKVAEVLPSAASSEPPKHVRGGHPSTSVLYSVDDMPLADVYADQAILHNTITPAEMSSSFGSFYVNPSSFHPPAGLTVVSGNGAAVPVRPATTTGASQSHLLGISSGGAQDAGKETVSAMWDVDDTLEDLNTPDLADMFVTGEEIGGLRYQL